MHCWELTLFTVAVPDSLGFSLLAICQVIIPNFGRIQLDFKNKASIQNNPIMGRYS